MPLNPVIPQIEMKVKETRELKESHALKERNEMVETRNPEEYNQFQSKQGSIGDSLPSLTTSPNRTQSSLHLNSLPKPNLNSWKSNHNTSLFRSPTELVYEPCSPASWSSASPHSNHRSMIGYFESVLLKPAHHRLVSILNKSDTNSKEFSVQLTNGNNFLQNSSIDSKFGKLYLESRHPSISSTSDSSSNSHSNSNTSSSTLPDLSSIISTTSLPNSDEIDQSDLVPNPINKPISTITDYEYIDSLIIPDPNRLTPKQTPSSSSNSSKPIRPKLCPLLSPRFPRSPPTANHTRRSTLSTLERASVREGEERRSAYFSQKALMYGFGYEFNHVDQSRSRMMTVDGVTDMIAKRLDLTHKALEEYDQLNGSVDRKRGGTSAVSQEGSLLSENDELQNLALGDAVIEKDGFGFEKLDENFSVHQLTYVTDWIKNVVK